MKEAAAQEGRGGDYGLVMRRRMNWALPGVMGRETWRIWILPSVERVVGVRVDQAVRGVSEEEPWGRKVMPRAEVSTW